VTRARLTKHFHFVSFTTETREVYRALDLIAFPNQEVGLGRPVIEAAANARPVVASGSANGADILIPDETGLLVARNDPAPLAEAIERLLVDPDLRQRMGEAAAALARDRFSPARNAAAIEAVYDSVLGIEPTEPTEPVAPELAPPRAA